MPFKLADGVRDVTTSTGTGNITLAATPSVGYRTLGTLYAATDTFWYILRHTTLNEWESGLGTYNGSNVFVRTTVYESSNANALVNFSAGVKVFAVVLPGSRAELFLTGLAANSVTNTILADMAALTVKGNATNAVADPSDIAATVDGHVLRRAGTALGFGTIATAGITANAVTNTIIRDSAGLSVIGRSANTTGDPADIAAVAASGAVLRESGSTIGFGTVATAGITDNAVTNAKAADVPTATFKGRVTAGTGDPEDLTATQATSLLNNFTTSLKGLVPASGGGTTNFLRADGMWAAPPGGGGGRTVLTAARTYFVRTGGSDANDGLSAGTAFLTIGRALTVISQIDFGGFVVTVDIGAGTWSERIVVPRCVGQLAAANLIFNGAGATTIISPTIGSFVPSVLVDGPGCGAQFQNMRIEQVGAFGIGLTSGNGGQVIFGAGMEFGACAFASINVGRDATVTFTATASWVGNVGTVVRCAGGFAAIPFVLALGTRTVTQVFEATNQGYIELSAQPTGTVTGSRYSATNQGYINTFGGGTSYIPGSTAGTPATAGTESATGGLYV